MTGRLRVANKSVKGLNYKYLFFVAKQLTGRFRGPLLSPVDGPQVELEIFWPWTRPFFKFPSLVQEDVTVYLVKAGT